MKLFLTRLTASPERYALYVYLQQNTVKKSSTFYRDSPIINSRTTNACANTTAIIWLTSVFFCVEAAGVLTSI